MSGLEMKYFVLKPRPNFYNDPYATASRDAIIAYAGYIRDYNEELANDLIDWVSQTNELNLLMKKEEPK